MKHSDTDKLSAFWSQRYTDDETGWDIGYPSRPIQTYIDQLSDQQQSILIPGAGNAYEAEYLHQQGFSDVHVLDIAQQPLLNLKARIPSFPDTHLHQENFFDHQANYDLIIEQTFFCSFTPSPSNRKAYVQKMYELLKPGGKLVGLWFDFPLDMQATRPPYGGSAEEYLNYFNPMFKVHTLERCHNSIPPRAGKELFGILVKRAHEENDEEK